MSVSAYSIYQKHIYSSVWNVYPPNFVVKCVHYYRITVNVTISFLNVVLCCAVLCSLVHLSIEPHDLMLSLVCSPRHPFTYIHTGRQKYSFSPIFFWFKNKSVLSELRRRHFTQSQIFSIAIWFHWSLSLIFLNAGIQLSFSQQFINFGHSNRYIILIDYNAYFVHFYCLSKDC